MFNYQPVVGRRREFESKSEFELELEYEFGSESN